LQAKLQKRKQKAYCTVQQTLLQKSFTHYAAADVHVVKMIYVKRQRTVKVRQSSGFTIRSQMRLLLIKQPQTCYFTKKAEIQEPMHRDLHYQISGLSKPGNLRVAKSRKRQTRLNYSASNINTTRVCTAAKKKRSYRSRIKPAV